MAFLKDGPICTSPKVDDGFCRHHHHPHSHHNRQCLHLHRKLWEGAETSHRGPEARERRRKGKYNGDAELVAWGPGAESHDYRLRRGNIEGIVLASRVSRSKMTWLGAMRVRACIRTPSSPAIKAGIPKGRSFGWFSWFPATMPIFLPYCHLFKP